MQAAELLAEQAWVTIERHGHGPRRAEGDNLDGVGAVSERIQDQVHPVLLKHGRIAHHILRGTHWLEGTAGARNGAVKKVIELSHGNEPRISRARGIGIQAGVISNWFAKPLGDVEHHRQQPDLWKRVGGDQVKVVARVLRRVVEVGDHDDGDGRRGGSNGVEHPSPQPRSKEWQAEPQGSLHLWTVTAADPPSHDEFNGTWLGGEANPNGRDEVSWAPGCGDGSGDQAARLPRELPSSP